MEHVNAEKKNTWNHPFAVMMIAILCCALWGSAFPAIKIGYVLFDIPNHDWPTQILFAGFRFTLAGVLTILIGSVMAKRMLIPKVSAWKKIILLSFFQTSIHYICFYIGLANTSGVKASILNGMNVFVAIFITALIFKQEKLTLVKIVGSILGFIGIVLVNLEGSGLDFDFYLQGEGFICLSTLCYGISSALIRVCGKNENPVMLSGYQFAFGGCVMIGVGLLCGGKISVWTAHGIALLIYLAFVSATAYTLWAMLLRYNHVSKVIVYGFFNPIFGAVFSAVFLEEQGQGFGWKEAVALLLISAGIWIVQKAQGDGYEKN